MKTVQQFLQQPVEKFIDTFCDPKLVTEDFKNALGAFTPCFTDIVILGLAHLSAVVLCSLRLAYLRKDRTAPKFHLTGFARVLKFSAILASLACLLIVLFQFNARLAADPNPLLNGKIAPFEWAQYLLAAVSWALFTAVFVIEIDRYTPKSGWMIRFPILFICAGEIAKLRFIVLLSERKDYFFWLYIAYFAAQGWLALLAIFFYPGRSSMTPVESTADFDYQELNAEEADKVCPEATANIFYTLTFGWISPLMVKGFKKPLQFEDIWELPPGDRVGKVSSAFESIWQKELNRPEGPSLTRACWRTTRGLIGWAIPFKLINDASQFIAPVFINLLLNVVDNGESSAKGYFFAGLMFAGLLVGTLADNQHFQRTMRAGFRLRALLVHEVFKKVLFLTPGAQQQFTSGRIFNLVTSDAETLQQLCQNLLGVISSPARIIGAVVLLYAQLGPASLVALVTLVIMMPIQAVLVRISSRLMRQSLQFTDERSKLEGELLGGIDVVKCSAWEDSFWDRIQGVRNQELAVLWRTAIVASINAFLLNAIPVIVSVVTFTAYVLLGHNLTAAKAFTALSLFTVLRMPLFQLPQLVTQLVNARVALQRLQELLAAEQQPPIPTLPPASPGEVAVHIEGNFAWGDDSAPALKGIKLEVQQGSLIGVVGSTGSGKTSLLSAALSLMKQVSGPQVQLRGKVAFVPQTAFIFGASVQDNILFGLPYEEARYQRAVQAAALGPDLVQLPAGDQTELGERGVNVSGGQKQRISIARAVYSGSDIVLLDDPLSALDAKVAREVYNGCVREELSETTRILVTNQLQFVSGSDLVLYMADGHIAEAGTYAELMKADKGFAQLMQQAEVEQEVEEELEDTVDANGKHPKNGKGGKAAGKAADSGRANETTPGTGSGTLTEREGRATGRVSLHVLSVYVKAMGGIWSFGLLMSWFILVEAARVGTTVWLSYWTGVSDQKGGAPHPALWYLAFYGAISGVQILFQLLSTFLTKWLSLHAARVLHNKMLKNLLRVPMAFFHTTPMGRIINRLTKDTSDVDKNLADFASFFLRSAMQLLSTVFLIGFVTPFALSALVPILLCFYLLYTYFQASVREIKRLDAISRSPVYGSIGEELAGLATIRAYRAEDRLILRNAELIDRSVIFSLVNQSMNRWLSVRLETLGGLSALAAAVLAVEQRGAASVFGLVLSYALQITTLTSITVRLASLVENNFNAVERIDEFCGLKEEAPLHIPGSKPEEWPVNGKVIFEDVKMRYRPGLPLVLRGLTVEIQPQSRVGVVGRTGAGKSSLINCLFRLMELESGRIIIDGLDIGKMGLHQLRSSMSLIPQTPVLFTGTLRSNLTPFGEHTDAQCWTALRRAHLAQLVENVPAGLDMMLSEGGAPLSAGQKQLVALARALLRHSKVFCLDEATASIDTDTDALIQKTINEEFADCTIIAIAHRLHTVIDADKVLVMDHGEAAEYGSPAELLSRKDGVFTSMVRETGEATARFLHSVANGEIDARADQSAQAKRALTRVGTMPKHAQSCREASLALVESARETAESLENTVAVLEEHASAEEFRRRMQMGLPPEAQDEEDVAEVKSAMLQALEVLKHINTLAARVEQRCRGAASSLPPGSELPPAGPGYGSVPLAGSAVGNEMQGDGNSEQSVSLLTQTSMPATISNETAQEGGLSGPATSRSLLLSCSASLPRSIPSRRSLDAPRVPLSPPSARQQAGRQWARLRKTVLKSRRRSADYTRMAGEDPSLSNTPELH